MGEITHTTRQESRSLGYMAKPPLAFSSQSSGLCPALLLLCQVLPGCQKNFPDTIRARQTVLILAENVFLWCLCDALELKMIEDSDSFVKTLHNVNMAFSLTITV